MNNKMTHVVAFLLVVIGGLNWGLIGLFRFDLIRVVLDFSDLLVRAVFILIGLSAVYLLSTHKKDCKTCRGEGYADGGKRPSVPVAPSS